jgi:GTP cyclohydrolase II
MTQPLPQRQASVTITRHFHLTVSTSTTTTTPCRMTTAADTAMVPSLCTTTVLGGTTTRRVLTVITTVFAIMCSSEAFASKSHSGIFGVRCVGSGHWETTYNRIHWRGGAAATPASSSSSSSSKMTPRRTPVTCTMQLPPPLQSSVLGENYEPPLPPPRNGQVAKNERNGVKAGSAPASDPNTSSSCKVTPVEYVAETKLPTDIGQFQLRAYRIPGAPIGQEPCVIYSRDFPPFGNQNDFATAVPVRIHDQCLTSEVFRSQRYDRN